ncbi:peptidoglycan-binding domain-containing protein [Clostridium ljungdahlii]|uniref:Putative peptidoglycan binding domain protein n=1 Tax=Clostridium ljungdahlii TaxID=1538 RepID=A0A168PCI9_9CLOT|nr:peptidoglycan-binding protein [Clostridium ljungdahlii]OAA87577.1 putative peptidoglycan binding domain protein [Clostridium ljungdahlii]
MKNTKHLLIVASIAAGITLVGQSVHAQQVTTTKISKVTTYNYNEYSTVTVKLNDKSDIVKHIQGTLNLYFGSGLAEDGVYGKFTEDAVKSVQKKLGVNVDGIFGPETAKVLLKYVNNTSVDDKNGFSPVSVNIQEQLVSLGYNLNANGNLSSYDTILAIKQFQKANNLPVTGKADMKLLNKLSKEDKIKPVSDTDYYISVNSSDHLCRIYQKINGKWKEIKCFDILSGKVNKGEYASGLHGKEIKFNKVTMKNFTQIDGLHVFYSSEKELGYGLRISDESAKFLSRIPYKTAIKVF